MPELPVGVRLIFQAAEELMPGGAIDAIAAGALTGVSRIFALHCDPRLAVGKVAVRPGPITSAADQIEVTLQSHGGHTSRPHLTGDLVYGLGTLITGVPGVLSRRIDPRNSTVMVWGAVNAGVAANAIPQTGTLAGTIRTASRDTWDSLESIVREIVSSLLAPLGIEHSLQYRRGVPPVVNEEISTRILTHAIEAIGSDVLSDTRQSGGGEDFSWYLEEVPGAMARLGVWSGRGPQLTCISRRSTWTSGRWRWVFGCWSTSSTKPPLLVVTLRCGRSSLDSCAVCASQRRQVPGPMLRAGRVRRSWTYSAGAPAISAASAITPR